MASSADTARLSYPPIRIRREACADYGRSSRLEWLETNGTGGFAMGTVAGANTRRYHGLLVAALRPPVDRHVLLSKLEETLLADGAEIPLDTNQYPGALHPRGFRDLVEFRLDPFPVWTWQAGGLRLEKRFFLVRGEQTAVLRYRASHACRLRVAPFLAFRDHHALTRANGALDSAVREGLQGATRTLCVKPYSSLPQLRIHHPGGPFLADGDWYRHVEYMEELDRGLEFREDLWRLGSFELALGPGADSWLVATLSERDGIDQAAVDDLERTERERRRTRFEDPLLARLDLAAEQFLVRRADHSPTVIAGYPWFTDWGRDTMISLPGLLIARGRLGDARDVILGFLARADRGLIPNRFPDGDDPPEYNTVDATLWLFQAMHTWLEAGGPRAFLRDTFYPAAKEILRHHRQGTHHGIRVDPDDGLLVAGGPGTQLTWMDAKVGDWVVTPRHGKPVEVNALFYNALRLMERWGKQLGDREEARARADEADRLARSFDEKFWNAGRGHLNDVVRPEGPDPSLRPNQLFAVSLPFPLLDPERQRAVVRAVEKTLLTPVGLRTLAPAEPGYRPRYRGSPLERDGAYHQGTVWPWLLGPYVRAYLAAFGRTAENVERCRALLSGLEAHLSEACLGSVSEVTDADPPLRPGGAPAQAWSVAELLAVLVNELGMGATASDPEAT